MVDIQSISAALASLKVAGEMASALKDVSDATTVQGKVFDLQRVILAAQQSGIAAQAGQANLIEKVRQLEREIAAFEDWQREKDRYQLVDFGSGTFAYVVKEECKTGEPSHRICPACFQKREKSILQKKGNTSFGQEMCWCPSCEKEFFLGNRKKEDWSYSASINEDWMSR